MRSVRTDGTARDAHVFVEGDPAGAVYGIVDGRVRIYSTTRGGREVTLAHHDRGQLLGELSAIDGLPRSASAVTVEASELVAVSGVAFNEWLVEHPELMQPLLRMLANRLRATTRQHVDHQSGDLVTRVAGAARRPGRSGRDVVRDARPGRGDADRARDLGRREPGSDPPRARAPARSRLDRYGPEPDRRVERPGPAAAGRRRGVVGTGLVVDLLT